VRLEAAGATALLQPLPNNLRKTSRHVAVCVQNRQANTKQNKTKRNKTKQNKTKGNETKQNETKQNRT
jgi:hypothetical protein